jgi:hypothetical protein
MRQTGGRKGSRLSNSEWTDERGPVKEPGGGSYEDFRSSLDVLRKRVCALGRGDQTTDFRLKARRALKIGILIVGGAVVAVVDAVTIPHHWNPYLAKASIDLGAALFKKGVLVLASEE